MRMEGLDGLLVRDGELEAQGEGVWLSFSVARIVEPSMESMPWPVKGRGGEGAHVRVGGGGGGGRGGGWGVWV